MTMQEKNHPCFVGPAPKSSGLGTGQFLSPGSRICFFFAAACRRRVSGSAAESLGRRRGKWQIRTEMSYDILFIQVRYIVSILY